MQGLKRYFSAAIATSVLCLSILAVTQPALAAAGDVDTSFGDPATPGVGGTGATSIASQPNGKFVVALGWSVNRYQANGSYPDRDFEGLGQNTNVRWSDVLVQSDGRVTAAGLEFGAPVLGRIGTDGEPESGFGSGGYARLNDLGIGVEVYSFAQRPTGGYVLVGQIADEPECSGCFNRQPSMLVVAANADGSLDTSFGVNGKVVIDPDGSAPSTDRARSVVVDANGRIVVVGDSTANNSVGLVVRLLDDGTYDTTFGAGGFVQFTGGGLGTDLVRGVVLDGNKIVVAGRVDFASPGGGTRPQVFVSRLNEDGTNDSSFNYFQTTTTNGVAFSIDEQDVLVKDAEGRLVLAAHAYQPGNSVTHTAIFRLEQNGTPDSDFGTGGVKTHAFTTDSRRVNIAAQPGEGNGYLVGWSGQDEGSLEIKGGISRFSDGSTPPTVSVASASVTEGDSGTTSMAFTATLSKQTTCDVVLSYVTSAGTATADIDYTEARTQTAGSAVIYPAATISAGSLTGTINVPVHGDNLDEADETFNLTVSNPTCATLSASNAVGTILDDEVPPNFVTTTPPNGITGVPRTSRIFATLDNPATSWSISAKIGRKVVAGSATCNSPCTEVEFVPALMPLGGGKNYTVTATAANADGSDSITWTFKTARK